MLELWTLSLSATPCCVTVFVASHVLRRWASDNAVCALVVRTRVVVVVVLMLLCCALTPRVEAMSLKRMLPRYQDVGVGDGVLVHREEVRSP